MRFFSRSTECPSPPKAGAVAPAVSPRDDEPPPEYELVFADEFDYAGPPDPAKWDYEIGMIRNLESQCYTNRLANARGEDGVLVTEAHKERFAIPHRRWLAKYANYTSASLFTRASWKYGRIEVRAKLPHGRGVWPAVWTMGAKGAWPCCGEIDVAEYLGRTPDQLYARAHWGRHFLLHRSDGDSVKVSELWVDFHLYAIEWTAEQIRFFFDQVNYFTFNVNKADRKGPFHQSHHLKINLALGGPFGGRIDDSILPQQFVVDYVRVYQKVGQ